MKNLLNLLQIALAWIKQKLVQYVGMNEDKPRISVPNAILIGSALISLSILISGGVIRVKSKTTANTASETTSPSPSVLGAAASPPPSNQIVKVSFDDDPVLGNKDAKVTIVEFSDYECPFCKRHFTQTWPDVKTNYIDKGLVKLIYRDLPLSFHPNAQKEAEAAECSRDQGGDEMYFRYHDEMFKRTTSNGTGIALDQLPIIAKDLGLDETKFKQCLDAEKYKTEVTKDAEYANSIGANGTPSFFIGKTEKDSVTGTKIDGARPFSSFQALIDPLLK